MHKLLYGAPHFYFIYQIKITYLHFQGHHTLLPAYLSFTTKLSPRAVRNCNLICWGHFETNNSMLSYRNSKVFFPAPIEISQSLSSKPSFAGVAPGVRHVAGPHLVLSHIWAVSSLGHRLYFRGRKESEDSSHSAVIVSHCS